MPLCYERDTYVKSMFHNSYRAFHLRRPDIFLIGISRSNLYYDAGADLHGADDMDACVMIISRNRVRADDREIEVAEDDF